MKRPPKEVWVTLSPNGVPYEACTTKAEARERAWTADNIAKYVLVPVTKPKRKKKR